MVTTRRVRHGIVLALAGLLAGLGIVAALFWDGGLEPLRHSATEGGTPGTETRSTLADLPPGSPPASPPAQAPGAEARAPGQDAGAGASPPAPGADERKAAERSPPRFDLVRVEPNGDAVVAGRGKPNTVVEMLVDGQPVARALTDPTGQFAIVPPPLPKGASEIVLRSKSADGQETRSEQSIAVSISPKGDTQPLVALTSPDAPTVVLSQPGAPGTAPGATAQAQPGSPQDGRQVAPGTPSGSTTPGGGSPGDRPAASRTADAGTPAGRGTEGAKPEAGAPPLRIVSVDGEGSGRLFISGAGIPGSEVRLYLNDTLIAPAKVGPDGRVAFTIGRGISAGRYKVRVEEVEPKTGKVVHRAEVVFVMPEAVAGLADTRQAQNSPGPARSPASPENTPAPGKAARADRTTTPAASPMAGTTSMPDPARGTMADGAAGTTRPGAVYVPEITTARITRGDNLWQISKRTYGRGQRYTVIFDANQDQIRDPDLIYPGQTFVLPVERRG